MKELCIVLAVILTTTLVGVGQAEVRYAGSVTEQGANPVTGIAEDEHYYVDLDLDFMGETVRVEVDRETYEKILNDHDSEVQYHNNLWYVKAWAWVSDTAISAADWLSFWD